MKEDDMDRTCSTYGRDEKCVPNCGRRTRREETIRKTQFWMGDGIRMGLGKQDRKVLTGCIWLRIRTRGELL
jgi:hypothetical protein